MVDIVDIRTRQRVETEFDLRSSGILCDVVISQKSADLINIAAKA
jgi:hypothetical protein